MQDRVGQLLDLELESQGSNLTVWFGHYPTSFIVQDPPGIRHVIRLAILFLSVCQKLITVELLMRDHPDERPP